MPPWKFLGDKAREAFHAAAIPRYEIFATLEKQAAKFKGREVFLCFTCDPYPEEDPDMIARQAIKILHAAGVKVRILTKAGMRSERDFDLLTAHPELSFYGVTLTMSSAAGFMEYEPKAANPYERRMSLRMAHQLGIPTWVSIEPVIDPVQSLYWIENAAPYTDMFKVGKWNHDKRADAIDWRKFAHDAKDLLESLGKQYYIKDDLRKYL
jgi:DNA repair photolyase